MRGSNLIVRVGGGFQNFKQQLAGGDAKSECLKISLEMEKSERSYLDTMVFFLQGAKASEKVINVFKKE